MSASTVSRTASSIPQLRRAVLVSALMILTELPKPVCSTCSVITDTLEHTIFTGSATVTLLGFVLSHIRLSSLKKVMFQPVVD